MKKIISVALSLLTAGITSFAQSKTPVAVTTAFEHKFPNASGIKWDKENAHEYEAEFTWKGEKYSANFNDKGAWLETESSYAFEQLPEKVQLGFNSSHKGATVKGVSKIESVDGKLKYEIEIKGLKTVEVFFNEDGSEIKKK
ncbi:MAG: PepSY-like domain-containing protein [Bacteroidota bacterium]